MSINRKVAVWMATHGVRQCDKRLVYDMRPSMGKQNKTRRVPYMVFFFFFRRIPAPTMRIRFATASEAGMHPLVLKVLARMAT